MSVNFYNILMLQTERVTLGNIKFQKLLYAKTSIHVNKLEILKQTSAWKNRLRKDGRRDWM